MRPCVCVANSSSTADTYSAEIDEEIRTRTMRFKLTFIELITSLF